MIDDVNKYIKKTYDENKLAHAFLIETNNLNRALDDIKKLVSYFYKKNTNQYLDGNNIEKMIQNDNLPSLKIIKPDGNQIKKEQVIELINTFKYAPIYTEKNIYIIYDGEKLNDYSANTLLKFIEEPESEIIGFFLVKNSENIISTIKSRCVKLKYYYGEQNLCELLEISVEEYDKLIDKYNSIIDIIFNKSDLLLHNEKIFGDLDKNSIEKLMQIILQYFENRLLIKYNVDAKYYILDKKLNDFSDTFIIQFINILIAILDNINYNVNMDLFLDKFAIEVKKIYVYI